MIDYVDSDRDSYSDNSEEAAGSSPIDATDTPGIDFSDTIDAQIGAASGLDSIESNLTLWLDATNIDMQSNTTLSDGDLINKWNDLSGNGNLATQTVAGSQPTFQSSDMEVYFNDDFMNIANAPIPIGASESYTLIAVSRLTADNSSRGNDGVISSGKNSTLSQYLEK